MALKEDYERIGVVTGANKGIGLETARQLAAAGVVVVLTARDEGRGVEATSKLHGLGFSNVVFHQLDVTDSNSITSLAHFIGTKFGRLDILVNNAGSSGMEVDEEGLRALNIDQASWRIPNDGIRNEFTNIESLTKERIHEILQKFLQDLKQDTLIHNGWPLMLPAYGISKTALNAYTRLLSRKYPKMYINCVHPGYVKTDLCWHTGPMSVEEGAKGPVKLALLPDGGPTGCYFNQTEVAGF